MSIDRPKPNIADYKMVIFFWNGLLQIFQNEILVWNLLTLGGFLKLAKFAGLIWELFLIRRILGNSEPNLGLQKSPIRRP
jgi:hypothetical protein